MKHINKGYLAPKVEVDVIVVEKGFAISDGESSNMEDVGGEKPEGDWSN